MNKHYRKISDHGLGIWKKKAQLRGKAGLNKFLGT